MRRWRTTLTIGAALAALLVVPQAATASPATPATRAEPGAAARPPLPGSSGPLFTLGHSKIKAKPKPKAADHTVTLRGVNVDGNPVAPLASLVDVTTGAEFALVEAGDTLIGSVPDGDYSLTGIVLTGPREAPTDLALYGDPTLQVHADVDLLLDARTAAEVKAVSPSATAARVVNHAQLVQTIAGQELVTIISGYPGLSLRAWPSANTTRPYHFLYAESQSEPLTTLPSPRVYNLAFPTAGHIPSTLTFTATPESLALVNTTYSTQGVPSVTPGPHIDYADFNGIGAAPGLQHPAGAPSAQRVYYTANGVKWKGLYFYYLNGVQVVEQQTGFRSYTAGTTSSATWNKAAFGPTMKVGHGQGLLLARPMLADTGQLGYENSAGNNSQGTTGTLTLFRNGQKFGETSTNPLAGDWTVPADSAQYRLDLSATRQVPWSRYATGIKTSWSFTSTERPEDPFEHLRGLLQPRITGGFDANGRAPYGTTFPLAVAVERPEGGTAVTSVSLEVSFNDGATWTAAPLTPAGTDRWTAGIAHPATGNGYAALRFKAADGSGNAVQQTVTRAYGLR
ncbi:hypothetical protein [Actinomadura sp. NEAU-AAG7]|uniref:hypothetical protein n=1 Tax=Actinomadura sp. NEAU-AAG7 TaxID=2839640 RepID=UPI001BE4A07F|nr:hypothetical protein [Actinomadura sp. NEAU-AAG7]MBT2207759.1 hypothetical protein [Actinomadura sp. NEAU-AAG7]